jgi:DNA topoisomerase-1
MPLTIKKPSKRKKVQLTLITDPVKSAETAGLRYVTDASPGIRRKGAGKGFSYIGVDGKKIGDRQELDRIKSLIIPPAWKDVWICPLANGHIQATGLDAKGRKQYRYHSDWAKVRSQTKFNRMILFSEALPQIRQQTERHLSLPGLPREKVLATVVQLLETTLIRVGNVEYAQENKSFGLTTMRSRHVDISGSTIKFEFRGKSGVEHDIEINDRRLAKIVKRCQELPGHELFQYLDDEGKRQTIDSEDVNSYLREITGEDFTAKDFRTWAGTVLAAKELEQMRSYNSPTEAKKNVAQAIKNVAKQLGNRPATCRKYYVHPAVIEAYLEGTLTETLQTKHYKTDPPYGLQPEEFAVIYLLEQHLVHSGNLSLKK